MAHLVSIYIDGGYLAKVLREEFGGVRIDFAAFSAAIAACTHPDAECLRTHYYHCLPYKGSRPTEEESERFSKMQRFLSALERLPCFTVKLGRLARRERRKGGSYRFEQKMVDVLLSLDMVHASLKGKITHVAIVAGDSDFVPAIEMIKNESVSVWLFHGERPHNDLWANSDQRIPITQDFINNVLWQG